MHKSETAGGNGERKKEEMINKKMVAFVSANRSLFFLFKSDDF